MSTMADWLPYSNEPSLYSYEEKENGIIWGFKGNFMCFVFLMFFLNKEGEFEH